MHFLVKSFAYAPIHVYAYVLSTKYEHMLTHTMSRSHVRIRLSTDVTVQKRQYSSTGVTPTYYLQNATEVVFLS